MSAEIIQAHYDDLEQIARRFGQQAEANEALRQRINASVERLANGGWVGEAADRFQAEMHDSIFPATQRLIDALTAAQTVTLQVRSIVQGGEQEAAHLFQGNGDAMSPASSDGASSGGVLGFIGDLFSGAGTELVDMVKGLGTLVMHPMETLKGLYYGVTHPGELWNAFKQPYVEDWNNGHPGRAIGRGIIFAASFLIGAKGADKAAKAGGLAVEGADLAEAATIAERAGELGKAGEVTDATRVADLADTSRLARPAEGAQAVRPPVPGPYLMPEGRWVGKIEMPTAPTPQVLGQVVEEPIRQLVAEEYGLKLMPKAPSATGPDIIVPQVDRARLGFDVADIKPLNETGIRKFWSQLDSWRDYGWAGGPKAFQGKAAMFGYDSQGHVYLYGIYDM